MGVLQPLYDLVPALGLGGAAHHPAVGFRTLATGQVAAVLIQRPGGLSFHHRRMIVSLVFLHFPVDMMGILSYIVLSISYWCHVILHQLN